MQLFEAVPFSTVANVKLARESPHIRHVSAKVAVYMVQASALTARRSRKGHPRIL